MTEMEGNVEGQLIALYAEREKLERTLGTADADELIAMVEELRAQAAAPLPAPGRREGAAAAGGDPDVEPAGRGAASPVASLEQQLSELYAERERLERELGVADAGEVLALVRGLEDQLRSFREHGPVDETVVAEIRALAAQLGDTFTKRELVFETQRGDSMWQLTLRS